jgi:hypothetical protein
VKGRRIGGSRRSPNPGSGAAAQLSAAAAPPRTDPFLLIVPHGAVGDEKLLAVLERRHRRATGWRGPVMVTVPTMTVAEWERHYAHLAA